MEKQEIKKQIKNLHIGLTGRHKAYYTKYVESIVNFSNFSKRLIMFTGNLTISSEKAQKYANEQKASKKWNAVIYDEDTPLRWNGKYIIEAFGVIFKLSKNRNVFWEYANEEFWNAWKKNKEEVKEAGFWLKKNEDTGEWLIFKKSEGEYEETE